MRIILYVLCLSLALAGCFAPLPPLSPRQVDWALAHGMARDAKSLENARLLYQTRCGSCHGAYTPSKYPQQKWRPTFERMAPKAKLTATDKDTVWRYIQTANSPE